MSNILFKGKNVESTNKIKSIIRNPAIEKIVNEPSEKRELISEIKKYRSGGITKGEARKILGKFHYDKKDSLSGKETAALAKAWGIDGSHRYTKPNDESGNRKTNYSYKKESKSLNNSASGSKSRRFGMIRSLH